MSNQSHHLYEFGPFTLDAEKRVLRRNDDTISLPPKVLDTLLGLVERRGNALTKDELLNRVWGDTAVEEGGLARNVSMLRKALGERPDDHRYIVTLPGRGYQFVAEVKERWGETEKPAGTPLSSQKRSHRTVILAASAMLVIGTVAYLSIRRPFFRAREPQQVHGRSPSASPEAYESYLRGRYYANRQNKDDNETAVSSLERAVALDPTFAPAYAELAQAYVWRFFLFAPQDRTWEEKAFVAAEKALSLDPNLPVAHLARGRLLWTPANHFPHDRAIREYRRALELNPQLEEARNQLALIYCHIGYFDEALRESERAVETNPGNNLAVYRKAQTLIFQGKYDDGLSVLRSIPEKVNPALVGYQIPWALFNLGRRKEAADKLAELLKEYPEDTGGLYTSLQAVVMASTGQERQAESRIREAAERGKGFGHFHHSAYHIACAYALLDKAEPAIRWLEAAAQDGFPCYPLFERDSNLDRLRRDPRFTSFMARSKQQWESYRALF